jgi:predicted ester cyclase
MFGRHSVHRTAANKEADVLETNKQLARRFIAAFAAGDTSNDQRAVAEDVFDHDRRPGLPQGRAPLLDAVAGFAAAFPHLEITIEQEIAEDDLVFQYGEMSGTHKGAFFGIPPTDTRIAIAWLDTQPIKEDRIVGSWHLEDIASLLTQLGTSSSGAQA